MSPDHTHFVELSDGTFEDVTQEELEILSDWLTQYREPLEPEKQNDALVAQWPEQSSCKREVGGSTPSWGTNGV